jgi:hypothetical protein
MNTEQTHAQFLQLNWDLKFFQKGGFFDWAINEYKASSPINLHQ